MSTILIRDMAADERPREKMLHHGPKALSDAELMAIIFSTGMKGKSVIQLSQEILADNQGHLSRVARLSVQDFLNRYKGIGQAKAITLLAALEMGARAAADAAKVENPVIRDSLTAYELMRHRLERLDHEEMWVMLLSQAGKSLRETCVGRGGVAATYTDVKLIMKPAIEHLASAIILFHNHPSGNLRPSTQDDNLTEKIKKAAALLDIRLNDHIIITDSGYYSYNDEGRL